MIIFLSFTLIIKHRILLVAQFPSFFKRTQNGFQKESFYNAKGVLLECKTSPFGTQKEPFWNAKGLLLECRC